MRDLIFLVCVIAALWLVTDLAIYIQEKKENRENE